jgi:WD40 repeat protein
MSKWRDPDQSDLGPQERPKTSKSEDKARDWHDLDEKASGFGHLKQIGTRDAESSVSSRSSLWQAYLPILNSVFLVLLTFFLATKFSQIDKVLDRPMSLSKPLVERAIAISPDSKTMTISDEDGGVGIWSIDGKPLGRLDAHEDEITRILYSIDGKMLFTASLDKTVGLWDLTSGKLLTRFSLPNEVLDLSISPDNKTLWAMTSKEIFRWDITTQKPLDPTFVLPSPQP